MVARVEIQGLETTAEKPAATPAADPNRPAWLPEQFKTPEDFAKSYADQRAEITRLQQGTKKEQPAQEPAKEQPPAPAADKPVEVPADPAKPEGSEKPVTQDDAAKKALDTAGVDVAPFQTEYDTTGDVSEDGRAKIAKALEGQFGAQARAVVDQFIEGQKIVHANDRQMYMDAAGGEDQFKAMVQWAKEALPPEQVAAYNAQVNSRDRHATVFAIEGLKAKYVAANGRIPNLLKGNGNAATGTQPFASSYEMTKAMQDPRYKADPAYRDSVAKRLAASQFN